jgi:fimbrial chaperone protein
MRSGATWLCTALLGLAAGSSAAGSFSVAPTRVELDANTRTAVVTLRNADPKPLTVQVTLVDWAQPTGEDRYQVTRDLLATPPVFTLAPESEQIVRIALRRAPDTAQERPYRIFFQEVPQAAQPGSNSLNVALRVGVPVFVLATARSSASLRWEARRTTDGKLQIDAINDGLAHVQVTGFALEADGASASRQVSAVRYVLPGSRISWTTEVPAGTSEPDTLRLQGDSDRGPLTATLVVAAP